MSIWSKMMSPFVRQEPAAAPRPRQRHGRLTGYGQRSSSGLGGYSAGTIRFPGTGGEYSSSEYDDGFFSRNTSRILSGWNFSTNTIDWFLYLGLEPLRARARELVRKTAPGKKYLRLMVKGLVGPRGIQVQSRVSRMKDGDMMQDKAANKAIEEAWERWSTIPANCDYTERETWVGLLRLGVSSLVVDGEILIRKHEGPDEGEYGIRLELIDPEFLDIEKSGAMKNGNTVRLGVEYSPEGRRERYHFRQKRPDGHYGHYSYVSSDSYTVEASHIIHIYRPDFIDQSRGFSLLHAAMMDIKQLDSLREALVVKSRVSASTTTILTSPEEQPYEGDLDDGQQQSMEPGTIKDFGNRNVHMADSNFPDGSFSEFIKMVQHEIAAGLEQSYSSMTGDLTAVNFSSIRAGVLEDRDTYIEWQAWLIEQLAKPIYNNWLKMAWTAGKIRVNGRALGRPLEHYQRTHFQGRRWDWVDPLKDINATAVAISNKITSRSQVMRDKGLDPEATWEEIASEEALMKELGIEITPPKMAEVKPDDKDEPPPPAK